MLIPLLPAGAVAAEPATLAGVQQVAHRVAEHVEAVHDHGQAHPRPQRQVRGDLQVLAPLPLSMPPQLGMSGGSPKLRMLSAAAAMITPPTLLLKMMIGAAMLGSTWHNSDRRRELPIAGPACK